MIEAFTYSGFFVVGIARLSRNRQIKSMKLISLARAIFRF